MIIKQYKLNKEIIKDINFFLLYGSNEALIEEAIDKIFKPNCSKNIYNYEENEILANVQDFQENIYNKSFFESDKLIIINRATDKLLTLFKDIIEKIGDKGLREATGKGIDTFLKKRCPYIMGLHASPELHDNQFHFHVEFYPPLRHGDKPKVLAGSESMAGVFIMDVLPEDSAKVLR